MSYSILGQPNDMDLVDGGHVCRKKVGTPTTLDLTFVPTYTSPRLGLKWTKRGRSEVNLYHRGFKLE